MTKIGNHINLKFAKMKKIVSLIMLWVVSIGMLYADNVEFTANAPDVVISGEQFRLTFTAILSKIYILMYSLHKKKVLSRFLVL